MIRLLAELADVLGAVIMGPPSRAVARAAADAQEADLRALRDSFVAALRKPIPRPPRVPFGTSDQHIDEAFGRGSQTARDVREARDVLASAQPPVVVTIKATTLPRKPLTPEGRAKLEALLDRVLDVEYDRPADRPGLVPCPKCGTDQGPREGGRLAVHYPTREAIRPCPGSWPEREKSRAA